MAKMALFSVINWPCFQLTKTVHNDLSSSALGSSVDDMELADLQ